jgi:hypothetical protein
VHLRAFIFFWVHLRALTSFFSSVPSSSRPLKVVCFLPYLLLSAFRALTLFLFECALEPSIIKGSAFPTLPPFKCTFEPSFPFECAFEPSPHFFSSAPSSPWPLKIVRFLTQPSSSAPSSSHPKIVCQSIVFRTLRKVEVLFVNFCVYFSL